MSPASHARPTSSIWKRFWSPTSLLQAIPEGATADDAEAIRHRNDVWLKTYMDLYILRWGALWFCSVVLVVLATEDSVPSILFGIALLASIGSLGGLVSMIWTFRRASSAIDDRTRRSRGG